MTDDEFDGWVALHCEATAASAEAAASLLTSRAVFVADWSATAAELGECTRRMLRNLRVPKWANEHAEAVGRELMALRRERDARPQVDFSAGAPEPPRCPLCGGSGLVAVPHPLCVLRPHDGPPALGHYPGTRMVVTGAVLCDAPDCEPGRDARHREAKRDRPRLALNRYLAALGHVDAVGMLRQFERDQAAACRRAGGRRAGTWDELIGEIQKRNRKEAA